MHDWTGAFEQALDVQPPVTAGQLEALPGRRGVVLLATAEGRPVTMVTAADMKSRARHRLAEKPDPAESRAPDLAAVTSRVWFSRTYSPFESDLLFLRLAPDVWPGHWGQAVTARPPWFVQLQAERDYPTLNRTRRPLAGEAPAVGPFVSGASAERFVRAVQDGFDLCREEAHLAAAPRAPRCTYGQMRRCLCPCDGTVSPTEYRQAVLETWDFAAGRRAGLLEGLESQMKQRAAEQAFEAAAGIKNRLQRLGELEAGEFGWLAPAEGFAFLSVQRGARKGRVRLFAVCGQRVAGPVETAKPYDPQAVREALDELAARLGGAATGRRHGPYLMGLVTRYLFAQAGPKRGVWMRASPALPAERVIHRLAAAAEDLRAGERPG